MPEAGYLPIPQKLARAGREGHGAHLGRAHERHRLRHHRAAHHAGGGGRRAARRWCESGDRIRLSVKERRLDLLVEDAGAATARRRGGRRRKPQRGYARLYAQDILQADEGCDFAFLRLAAPCVSPHEQSDMRPIREATPDIASLHAARYVG